MEANSDVQLRHICHLVQGHQSDFSDLTVPRPQQESKCVEADLSSNGPKVLSLWDSVIVANACFFTQSEELVC